MFSFFRTGTRHFVLAAILGVVFYDYNSETPSDAASDMVVNVSQQKLISDQHALGPQLKRLAVRKDDKLNVILQRLGVSEKDIQKTISKVRKECGAFSFRDGQIVKIKINKHNANQCDLMGVCFRPTLENEITLTCTNGNISIHKKNIPLQKTLHRVDGKIMGSFYRSAQKLGVPSRVVHKAVSGLSYVINFQHSLRQGDPFEILYEVYKDDQGTIVKTGGVKYVAIVSKGKLHRIYGHASAKDQSVRFFNAKGESIQEGLLMTPVDPRRMRITSRFTKSRMHPIKGYCRAHKGVDFGAPRGTPVYAAADGVVTEAGYRGDYGNKVTIRHAGGYKTVYAHLSKMRVKRGARVKQKQIIGNIGSTGLATGPHLHHEVIYKNRHINPEKVSRLPSTRLKGKSLKEFQYVMREINSQIVGIPSKTQLAASTTPKPKG